MSRQRRFGAVMLIALIVLIGGVAIHHALIVLADGSGSLAQSAAQSCAFCHRP